MDHVLAPRTLRSSCWIYFFSSSGKMNTKTQHGCKFLQKKGEKRKERFTSCRSAHQEQGTKMIRGRTHLNRRINHSHFTPKKRKKEKRMLRSKPGMGKMNQLLVKAEWTQTNRPPPFPCKRNCSGKRKKERYLDPEGGRGSAARRGKRCVLEIQRGEGYHRRDHLSSYQTQKENQQVNWTKKSNGIARCTG
jgi:hypothetical protein